MNYAERLRSEIEEYLRNQALFLAQARKNHQEYMEYLDLSDRDIRELCNMHPDGSPFLVLVVEGSEIEFSVGFVPDLNTSARHDALDSEKLIVAKCKCTEDNFFGSDRLKKCSHLNNDLHQALIKKLQKGPEEKSIESALQDNCIVLQASH